MIRKLAVVCAILALVGGLAFWFLSAPRGLDASEIAAFPAGDPVAGEQVFWVGGCASCHARDGAKGDDKLDLAGGHRLVTEFGTFVAPNISSDPSDGIGAWTIGDFANAMMRGVSPDGQNYYPSFPYTSYVRMTDKDVADLFAFMKTLPAIQGEALHHELGFPFNIRRGIGLWKLINLKSGSVIDLGADADAMLRRGQYLVEGPGHCGECHTPRDFGGGLDYGRWLSGAKAAEGEGVVPNITGGDRGIGDWSAKDIAYYLETGFTPEFDSVGGSMVSVQENMAKLTAEDRDAIAAYLKAVPPHAQSR